jgi:hypothetical protein
MNVQTIYVFFGVLVLSFILFILADKYFWTVSPWIIIAAIMGGFLTFLAIKQTAYNVAAIAVLVASLTLTSTWIWNLYNDRESKKLRHQHITPEILCFIEYPIKTEGEKTFRDKRNPDIVLVNKGPIKIVSVTCDVELYVYDENKDEIVQFISSIHGGLNHLISKKEMDPFSEFKQSWIGINGDHLIGIYHIKALYHRESDLEQFSREEYVFIKQQEIVPQERSKKDQAYQDLIKKVTGFDVSRISGRLRITAANEHTWLAETDGSVAAMIDPSGKLIGQTPELQSIAPKEGYPFLEITPRRWKATGSYIDSNTESDDLEVKILVRALNVGSSDAMITSTGFDTIETVPPGSSVWATKAVRVGIKKGSPITLDDYMRLIDEGKEKLNWRFFVYYRPANKPNELFKVIFSYSIGKNDVIKIAPALEE